jgi:hypothetical protein
MESTIFLCIALAALALWLGWKWRGERRRAQFLQYQAVVLAGHADPARTPFELLQQAVPVPQWTQLAKGGDLHAGVFDNKDQCPCRHTYTCASTIIALNAWPNPVPNPVAGFPWNAPPREKELLPCPGNCVAVCTEVWRGWTVVQNQANGKIQIVINTLAQYHCKEPKDPDASKPPKGEELPPKPGDVIP